MVLRLVEMNLSSTKEICDRGQILTGDLNLSTWQPKTAVKYPSDSLKRADFYPVTVAVRFRGADAPSLFMRSPDIPKPSPP